MSEATTVHNDRAEGAALREDCDHGHWRRVGGVAYEYDELPWGDEIE